MVAYNDNLASRTLTRKRRNYRRPGI